MEIAQVQEEVDPKGNFDDIAVNYVLENEEKRKLRNTGSIFKACERYLHHKESKKNATMKVTKPNQNTKNKHSKFLKIVWFWNIMDMMLVISCLLSIFLFFMTLGFMMKSKFLWGILHLNNGFYIITLFAQWFKIYLRSKTTKSNQGISKTEIIMTLITTFPIDLIALVLYSVNKTEIDVESGIDSFILSMSRIGYLLRVYYIRKYIAIWEDQLAIGDFLMFFMKTMLYSAFLLHMLACIWHRIACKSFTRKHFIMTPDAATLDVCEPNSWIVVLLKTRKTPLLDHPNINVLGTHYLASLYWAVTIGFGLGLGDFTVYLTSDWEIVFTAIAQITAWLFTLTFVNGTLTSLLLEDDTERENFLTRRFAVTNYINFSTVKRSITKDVINFCDYLWLRRKGIMHLDLVEVMPKTMQAEVSFEVHNFVFEKLPLFRELDKTFMMNLAVYMEHTMHLAGEILFERNDVGDRMYYVLQGNLEILCEDNSRVIANIRSGSAIGEIHLIHAYPHVATVRCGSDCDIIVLTKSNFWKLMESYPELWKTFRERLEERFEQSQLLLSLCEKHNNYPRAFSKVDHRLRPFACDMNSGLWQSKTPQPSTIQLSPALSSGDCHSRDYDGLSIPEEIKEKISNNEILAKDRKSKPEKRQKILEYDAFKSLESDVTRANSLAKDLGIRQPPLFITAPSIASSYSTYLNDNVKSDEQKRDEKIGCANLFKTNGAYTIFRSIVSLIIIGSVWFYTYAIAFRSRQCVIGTFMFHITDVIFAINYWMDLTSIVVTPQKTLENRKEILIYRLKEPSTYYLLLSILPWEYLMTPLIGSSIYNLNDPKEAFAFNCFKLNRCLQLHVVVKVVQELESTQAITIMHMFLMKFIISVCFTIHIFAVLFRLIREYAYGWNDALMYSYEIPIYWATQVTTNTGFGDMLYTIDLEVVVLALGCVLGMFLITYYSAKNAALLSNSAKRRVVFKQTFTCVKTFMQLKKFPKSLMNRVLGYYRLQWLSHEGTLIPSEYSVIYDLPKSFLHRITMSQAKLFCEKVPLVQNACAKVQQEIAAVLRQFFIPPDEVLLYPFDKRRELFFIVQGFCKVKKDGELIGTFTEGNYFGLCGFLFGENMSYEIVTETNCLIFGLLFDDFAKIARSNYSILRDYQALRGENKYPNHNYATVVCQNRGTGKNNVENKVLESDLKSSIASVTENSLDEAISNPEHSDQLKGEKWIKLFNTDAILPYILVLPSIDPNGNFFKAWTTVRTIGCIFITSFVFGQLAFASHPGLCFIIMLACDIFAWTDIYILFHVAYCGSNGQLITDKIMTAKNYLRKSFILDFVSAFPIDYFLLPKIVETVKNITGPLPVSEYVNNRWVRIVTYLRLLRTVQVYRVICAGTILEKAIFTSLTLITLLEVVPILYLFVHITTCILIWGSCYWSLEANPSYCPYSSIPLNFNPLNRYPPSLNSSEAGLIPPPKSFDIFNPYILYTTGLYWTIQTSLNVGYGDFNLFDEDNIHYFLADGRMYAVWVILSGVVVSIFLGSKLTACIDGEDPRKGAIRDKMKVLFDFMIEYEVPRTIQRRVREVYFNAWEKTKGMSTSELFTALHPTLRSDVTNQLYGETLRKSPLLKDLDDTGIRMLSAWVKEMFVPEGEFVMREGDLNDDIFLISSGVFVGYGFGGRILCYLSPGSIFGELSALYEVQRLYSAVAATESEVFVFQRKHFLQFLNLYPKLRLALQTSGLIHYRETMEAVTQDIGIKIDLPRVEPFDKISSISTEESSCTTIDIKEGKENLLFVNMKVMEPLDNISAGMDERDNEDRNSHWWSFMCTFGRIPRDEMGLVHIHQDRNKCNIFDFVIHPLCPLCSEAFFVVLSLIFTCLSCSLAAYELAFRAYGQSGADKGENLLFSINVIVESFFLIRFIGNFHLAYFDESAILITDQKKIIRKYATQYNGLGLDLIAFPLYFFIEPFLDRSASVLKGFQLFRILLFWRYLDDTDAELKTSTSMLRILKMSIVLCFIFHFCACFWYLIACHGYICAEDSWMWRAIEQIKIDLNIPKEAPDPHISSASRYFLSIFYVSTTISFTGLNYIQPAQVKEIAFTVGLIFTTVFLVGYLIGEISQCLVSQLSTRIHYEHQLTVLEAYFQSNGLRKLKLKEVGNFYKAIWTKRLGIPFSTLFEDLPYTLKADLAYAVYGSNVKSCQIIGKLEDTIIRQLCSKISHELYLAGSRIVRSGDVCDAMYFIKKGKVNIIDEAMNLRLQVRCLNRNESFGEVKILLPPEQYKFSYFAIRETEVGVLKRSDLEAVMNNYPFLMKELHTKARHKRSKKHSVKINEQSN